MFHDGWRLTSQPQAVPSTAEARGAARAAGLNGGPPAGESGSAWSAGAPGGGSHAAGPRAGADAAAPCAVLSAEARDAARAAGLNGGPPAGESGSAWSAGAPGGGSPAAGPYGAGPATGPRGAWLDAGSYTASAADDVPVVFRVLGALEVCRGEQVVVSARRQGVVLGMLLAADRTVSVDGLTDAIWGGCPPPTARAQVQNAVSGLRRSLARAGLGGRIVQAGPGYRIETRPGELDLAVFDTLAARGRGALRDQDPATARDAFRRALALWRGEPFAGLDSDALRARAGHIAERRVEVLEQCLDAELRLGLHHEALGEITALAAEYPLRERPALQLMTALYRCGRRAEALAAYQAVRRTFVDELGLEPGPALQRLESAILDGSADLDPHAGPDPVPARGAADLTPPAPRVPRMLPAPVPDFTGCEDVLGAVRRHLTGRPDPHAPRTAVITGAPGAGKSALAVRAAHALAASFPDGQLYARACDDDGDARDVLATLLAALGHTGAAVPDSAQGRAALYRSALVRRRVLVVVDDLTCASQLRVLVPGTADSALLVTARTRLDVPPGMAVYEAGLPDLRGGVALLAGMLGPDRVAAEPSDALELVALCGRLPLALRAASARLRLRPQWTLADLTGRLRDERRRLDELAGPEFDPRAGCDAACARLDAAGVRLLGRLGLLDAADFPAWVAAPLLGLPPRAAADVLDTLADARLVEVRRGPAAGARYRLPDLVRLRARELLAAEEPEAECAAAQRRLLAAWSALAESAAAQCGAATPSGPARWATAPGGVLVAEQVPEPGDFADVEAAANWLPAAERAVSGGRFTPGPVREPGDFADVEAAANWLPAAERAVSGGRFTPGPVREPGRFADVEAAANWRPAAELAPPGGRFAPERGTDVAAPSGVVVAGQVPEVGDFAGVDAAASWLPAAERAVSGGRFTPGPVRELGRFADVEAAANWLPATELAPLGGLFAPESGREVAAPDRPVLPGPLPHRAAVPEPAAAPSRPSLPGPLPYRAAELDPAPEPAAVSGLVARTGPDPLAWYEQERGGLLAAVRMAAAADAAQVCRSLALALAPLAQAQVRYDDWRESHELALAAARRGGDRLGEAVLLSSLGALDVCERRFDRAAARLALALDALDRLGERHWAQLTRRSLRALDRAAGHPAPADASAAARRTARPTSYPTPYRAADTPAAACRTAHPTPYRPAFSRRPFEPAASGTPDPPPPNALTGRPAASYVPYVPAGNDTTAAWRMPGPGRRQARRTPDLFGEL